MFSDISFSDSHLYVDNFECQKLNFRLNKSKVAVPHFWVLPIKTELVARKAALATLYLEILRLHNHFDGDDDGIGDNDDGGIDDGCNGDDDGNSGDDNGDDDNDHGNGRVRCSIEVKGKMKIILQVAQLDLGSLHWQLVI